MRKVLFIVSVIIMCSFGAHGQPDDSTIAHLFRNRGLNPADVTFNSVLLIPQLYKENKTDTLNAVIQYWEDMTSIPEPLFSYFIIDEIRRGTFSEKLYRHIAADSMATKHANGVDYYKLHIVSNLRKYLYGCHIRDNPRRYLHTDTSGNIVAAYAGYYAFLQSLAQPLCDKKGLTPVENFLAHFYARPDTNMFYDLKSPEYKGTLIRDAALRKGDYSKNNMTGVSKISGVNMAVNTGIWMLRGNLSALQHSPMPAFGFLMGGRSNKVTYDVSFKLWWATAPAAFTLHKNDSLFPARYQGGGFMGIDLGYQLYRKKRSEVDALAGIEYSVFDAAYSGDRTNSYYTPDVNLGLGYRYFFRHPAHDNRDVFDYLAVQTKYHLLNYSNPGGSPVNGSAFSITLECGVYIHNNDKFDGKGAASAAGDAFWNELLKAK